MSFFSFLFIFQNHFIHYLLFIDTILIDHPHELFQLRYNIFIARLILNRSFILLIICPCHIVKRERYKTIQRCVDKMPRLGVLILRLLLDLICPTSLFCNLWLRYMPYRVQIRRSILFHDPLPQRPTGYCAPMNSVTVRTFSYKMRTWERNTPLTSYSHSFLQFGRWSHVPDLGSEGNVQSSAYYAKQLLLGLPTEWTGNRSQLAARCGERASSEKNSGVWLVIESIVLSSNEDSENIMKFIGKNGRLFVEMSWSANLPIIGCNDCSSLVGDRIG